MDDIQDGIQVMVADASHAKYADAIVRATEAAARDREAGIAPKSRDYLVAKMKERKAVIALYNDELAGFCYVETWENKQYVADSGLIVVPKFRGRHLSTRIKRLSFSLTRLRWPDAKIYGLTSSSAVMHINAALGYVPVPFSELTSDDEFWAGCGTPDHLRCVNCDVLARSHRRYCVCTGMVYDPARHPDDPIPVELPQEIVEFAHRAAN